MHYCYAACYECTNTYSFVLFCSLFSFIYCEAEWWVHSRPHVNGHQLHFDSDETRLEAGRSARHPICSTVLFLSSGVGGPTIATNQRLEVDNHCALASKGWLVQPKVNRLVTFDASVLHGVLPGRGLLPEKPEYGNRRLTFMVGFWKEISATDRGVDTPGPGQPFPKQGVSKYSWPLEMHFTGDSSNDSSKTRIASVFSSDSKAVETKSIHQPIQPETKSTADLHCRVEQSLVQHVWEPIDAGLSVAEVAAASSRSTTSASLRNRANGSRLLETDAAIDAESSIADAILSSITRKRNKMDSVPHYSACFQGF